jgi:hypothetical protein
LREKNYKIYSQQVAASKMFSAMVVPIQDLAKQTFMPLQQVFETAMTKKDIAAYSFEI